MARLTLAAKLLGLVLLWLVPWLALANAFHGGPPGSVEQLHATRTADGYWIDLWRDGTPISTTRILPGAANRTLELSAIDLNRDGHLDVISRWRADGCVWTQVWLHHGGAFRPAAPPSANLLVSQALDARE
jgi:hypothetical protein